MQVGIEIYALKNNCFLDNIISNVSKLKSFIKSLEGNVYCLHHGDKYDLYSY